MDAAEIFDKVRDIIVEESGVEPCHISVGANLSDHLHIGEFDLIGICGAVEEEFGISISADEFYRLTTVGDLCSMVDGHLNGTKRNSPEDGIGYAPFPCSSCVHRVVHLGYHAKDGLVHFGCEKDYRTRGPDDFRGFVRCKNYKEDDGESGVVKVWP